MDRILVTGGSGFIGTSLVEDLLADGEQVLSLDVRPPQNADHQKVFRRCDILDKPALRAVFDEFEPHYVVHLAAEADVWAKSLEAFRANTDGTANMVECIRATPSVRRTLFASTKLVVPTGCVQEHEEDFRPDTLYGQSKVISEQIVRRSDLASGWSIIRPTSIWGPWYGTDYTGFFVAIAKGRYFHPGRCDPPKVFGFVGNACLQMRRLLAADAQKVHGRTFYLADYDVFTIRQWADAIAAAVGRGTIRTVPGPVMRMAAKVGDLLQVAGWKSVPMTTFRLRNMWTDTTGVPLESIQAITGPLPYTMSQGVDLTLRWLRSQRLLKGECEASG